MFYRSEARTLLTLLVSTSGGQILLLYDVLLKQLIKLEEV